MVGVPARYEIDEANLAAVVEALNDAGCEYVLAGSTAAQVWGDQEVLARVEVSPAPGQREAVERVRTTLQGRHGTIEICRPAAEWSHVALARRARTVPVARGRFAPVAILEDVIRGKQARDRDEDRWAIPRLEALLSRRREAGWED